VEQNKAILRHGAEAFNNRNDRSGWFEIHDPSVVAFGLAPDPLNLEGLRQFYSGLWTGFPDLHITVDDLIGENERVAWRLTVSGTHEGDFRGVAPTGTEVRFAAQYIFEFRNGKIVRRWTNFDRLGVLVQLGAIPAPASLSMNRCFKACTRRSGSS
jgi:predicted ester cyclase